MNAPFLWREKARSRLQIYSLSAHLFTAGFARDLAIEKVECLEFQLIIGIYGSRFLKIYFPDSLSRVHILRTFWNILGWRRSVFKCCITKNLNFKFIHFLVVTLWFVLYKLLSD